MFMIWYSLISFLYWIILILNFFFKILKLNNKLFSIILAKFNNQFKYFNLINRLESSKTNTSNSKFKALYGEYNFFKNSTNNIKNLNSFLMFTSLNKKLSGTNQNLNELNLLVTIFLQKSVNNNFKKINLNFTSIPFTTKSQINSTFNKYKLVKRNLMHKISTSVTVFETLETKIRTNWTIKYSPSNFIKYINSSSLSAYNILYLRKNKVFNKGRYSRNRQYYRTGVYWCLYVNIIAVVGIYFWFYRFTMNFGYLWWLLFIFISSFIVPKAVKYRLYNPKNLLNSYYKDLLWLSFLILNLKSTLLNIFNFFFKNLSFNSSLNSFFLNSNTNALYTSLVSFLNIITNLRFSNNNIYVWEYTNVNYYYGAIIGSRPVIFEKSKYTVSQLFSFILSK